MNIHPAKEQECYSFKKLGRDLEVPHGPLEMSWKSGSKRQIKVREILLLDQ